MHKLKRILILGILLSGVVSCVFIRTDDSIDLGNQYRYIQDYPQIIVHYHTKEYNGSGLNVIGPVVMAFNFDARYIIAKTHAYTFNQDSLRLILPKFWIVDKQKQETSVQPMDSVNFYQLLKEKKINLLLNHG